MIYCIKTKFLITQLINVDSHRCSDRHVSCLIRNILGIWECFTFVILLEALTLRYILHLMLICAVEQCIITAYRQDDMDLSWKCGY